MKRLISVLAVALGLFAGGTPAIAQERSVPHYFPEGIEHIKSPVGQWEAYLRYIAASGTCLSGLDPWYVASGSSEKVMKVERTFDGKKVTFIFDPWIRSEDGKHIYFYNYCGQKEITQKEFDIVAADYIQQSTEAMELGYQFYGKLEQEAVTAAANALGKPEAEFRKQLDQKVPDAPAITYRELWALPTVAKKSDFIPAEVHIGYISALGMAWLNSGVTYTSLDARITDYIYGKPTVVLHEFTHANPNLQSLPMSQAVDVELMASVAEMLLPEDKISVARHGYMRRVREWIWVFYGFNFRQAHDETVLFEHDRNLRIDQAKYNEYYGKLEEAKAELLKFFHTALPEYYGNQVFWGSMNEKLRDTRGVFSIQMALNYEPTLLCADTKGSDGKLECGQGPTSKWYAVHDQEILEIAKESWRESGKPMGDDDGMAMAGRADVAKLAEFAEIMGITREEGIKLARKYNLDVNGLKGKSPSELTALFFEIMQKEKRGKER